MTLGIAWVREIGSVRELIVASDSRLSGGEFWDSNPKIMLLPRSDCVISFAGSTFDAYPLMLQAYNAIKMYEPAETRLLDIIELKGHLIRMFNHSRSFISMLPHGVTQAIPAAGFMLSGYSWRTKQFHIWILHYDAHIGRFTFRPIGQWGGQEEGSRKVIGFIGDDDVVATAREQLISLLRERNALTSASFNMEPFEVLRDIIRGNNFPSVGGPIQLVKVYQHSNVAPFGVYWPQKKDGAVALLGRPLMDYERSRWGVLDPDNPTQFIQSEIEVPDVLKQTDDEA